MRDRCFTKAVVIILVTLFLTVSFSTALSTTKQETTNPLDGGSRGWYWKPTYPNYAPNGVPDFDQQQDTWKAIEPGPNGVINSNPAGDDFLNVTENRIVPGSDCHLQTAPAGDDLAVWAFCGPTAVADCLWWYDSKYSDPTGIPGDGKDNFPLVANYGAGDDHAAGNVPLLIEKLARAMKTNIKGTTYITDMNSSIHQWFVDTGLTNHFTVNTTNYVTFPYVEGQIENSQNVILLVGAYHQNTTKNVDQFQINAQVADNLGPWNWCDYQSFTPTVNRLDAIQICLVDPGPPCDVKITVYNAAGVTLGSSTMNPGPLGGIPTWVQFHFTPYIPLTPNNLYYFDVREVPGPPDQLHYEWFYAYGNPYPGGQMWKNNFSDAGDWTFKTEYYGGHRVSGHFLTCAGVDSDNLKIAVSDPINDIQNPAANHTVHNDAQYVSHDIYNVTIGSPYPNVPYHWYLNDYADAGNVTIVEQAVVVCSSNTNPNTPATPSGTALGTPGVVYTYTSSATDPNGDQLYYLFDWGDGTNSSWVGPYASGATASANHSWSSSGTYLVKVKVKDFMQAQSGWSNTLSVTINVAPNKPAKPSGTTLGTPNVVYMYTSSTTDPEGNQVYYLFDWGDGSNSSWVGPYASGATASANHSWSSSGTYQVKVKAKDTWQMQSSWSDPLSVVINSPPNKPGKPSGPTSGTPHTVYTYTTSTTDPESDLVYYQWDWGDGNISGWLGPYGSGVTASATHSWSAKGTYQVKVKAKDANNAESAWSDALAVAINTPPNKPAKPSGTLNGKINVEYSYTSSTTDPDGDQVSYLFDWGDGINSSWLGPYASGATVTAKHTWTVKGSYSIKVKAKDTSGAVSDWSDPLGVSMPTNQNALQQPLLRLLEWLFHRFPLLEKLLGSLGLL